MPILSRGIEAGGEGCRVGREVSTTHVSGECPRPVSSTGFIVTLRLHSFQTFRPFPPRNSKRRFFKVWLLRGALQLV